MNSLWDSAPVQRRAAQQSRCNRLLGADPSSKGWARRSNLARTPTTSAARCRRVQVVARRKGDWFSLSPEVIFHLSTPAP